jgi:membrane protein
MFSVLRQTAKEFVQDECPRLAAALAYYAIFSLPALLVLVVAIASFFADSDRVSGRLTTFFEDAMGQAGAEQIGTMLQQAGTSNRGWWGTLAGLAMLVVGATGVLLELQTALNRVWGVKPNAEQGGARAFVMKRALSLAMVLGIAFLLLVSLVVSWLLSEFGNLLERWAPDWLSAGAIQLIDVVASLTIIAALFAALLKYLPDARLSWRDVLPGAALTAVLFGAGKYGLSLYLAYSDVTSAYGAAGSLALVLLWTYYSAMIFFFGAEFTQVLSTRRGRTIKPEPGAIITESGAESKGSFAPS